MRRSLVMGAASAGHSRRMLVRSAILLAAVRHERGERGRLGRRSCSMRCCVEDEGFVALRRRPAGGGVKPPHAALAEDRRGER